MIQYCVCLNGWSVLGIFTCIKLLLDIRDCARFFSAKVCFLFLPLNSCFPVIVEEE